MSAVVRPFERRDRDRLTSLVNLHVGAVIPGVALSVNAVLGQLEREPQENIVDPWVAERLCLVAGRGEDLVAAALLHRFRSDHDVAPDYRGMGEIRWLACKVDALDAGRQLLAAALDQMRSWQVSAVGAQCSFPALGCYGVPDALPHIHQLLREAGFGKGTRTEVVLVARCRALTGRHQPELVAARRLGQLGARFTLQRDGREAGFIEVAGHSAEMARSSVAAQWADVGNLIVADESLLGWAMPQLLSVAAQWLLLGGITRLVDYWAKDVDAPGYLHQLQALGFQTLVVNECGVRRAL
ncbi:MAG TPA: hypothetical protein VKV27_16405 [Solirubrobacteraceae bacterium]|nr:hypothetical protein [Solirubrobacteraceae bacterium]